MFLLGAAPLLAHGPWQALPQCSEVPNESNDGDSFHVRAKGSDGRGRAKEYVFRLYFVDAPETDASFPERVANQAAYFKLTPAQTVQLGGYAKKFVEEKLARPFTVRTCRQNALGRSKQGRFYAFIETDEGDLAELLVANGMARVHGSGGAPVGLESPEREWHKLQRLENEARLQRIGGWGASVGRMQLRASKQPSKAGLDSFEVFFHPEKLAVAAEAEARLDAQPVSVPAGAQLDLNTATAAQLVNIRGIGPVIAQRIIAARPFVTADDLREVKGIGAKKYAEMRPYFRD